MLSVAFLPLVFSPISEQFGRRKIYVITTTLHALLFLPQIFVRNIAVIVVLRLLQGSVVIIFLKKSFTLIIFI